MADKTFAHGRVTIQMVDNEMYITDGISGKVLPAEYVEALIAFISPVADNPPEKPIYVLDGEDDLWVLCRDGKYTLKRDWSNISGEHWSYEGETIENIKKYYGLA